jgi:hypothetical protein
LNSNSVFLFSWQRYATTKFADEFKLLVVIGSALDDLLLELLVELVHFHLWILGVNTGYVHQGATLPSRSVLWIFVHLICVVTTTAERRTIEVVPL